MANLPESVSFDAGVYQIETADPVLGGDPTAISNKQAAALANRTRYLKTHVDDIEAAITAINAAIAAPLTTQSAGDDDTSAATTAFVHRAQGGIAVVDASGAGNVTLDGDAWGCATVILAGARTANGNIIFPTRGDDWHVVNRTTGTFQITCKTAAGAGVKVAQGRSKGILCDGTDIIAAETDLSTRGRRVTAATVLAAGDEVYVDFSGGTFALTLPASPDEGDTVVVIGNFLTSNLTILRNGQQTWNAAGAKVNEDIVLDRNAVRAVIGFYAGAWQA